MEPERSIHSLISTAISYITKRHSPAERLHFSTRRHFYYALVRTLYQGSEATATYPARPPLPLELVIPILRDAECTVLSRLSRHVGRPVDEADEVSLGSILPHTFTAPDLERKGWPLPLVVGKEIGPWEEIGRLCSVDARGADPVRKDWFSVVPFSAQDLTVIHSMQLFTRSRDQGWVNDPNAGSWSWFDIALIPNERGKSDRKEYSWQSHNNSPPASRMLRRFGANFGPNHEIWQLAQIGDRIVVRICAQFGGWSNVASMAILIVQEYFIPSFVPQ